MKNNAGLIKINFCCLAIMSAMGRLSKSLFKIAAIDYYYLGNKSRKHISRSTLLGKMLVVTILHTTFSLFILILSLPEPAFLLLNPHSYSTAV